jgi:hypothetical protein
MDLIDLFWNLRQQQQIRSAAIDVAVASSQTKAHELSLADLNDRFNRLSLVTQALSELLAERAHVGDADLLAKINEIDMRDGVRDGRAIAPARSCPKCGHSTAGPRTTCLYCGASLGGPKPFDGL